MTCSTENPPAPLLAPLHERRVGRELVLELVFRPLASALVPPLLRARVPPHAVVLANAALGLCAAFALARGELVLAALLLQMKTLLDNADGQLARVAERVTLTGRYLDTECVSDRRIEIRAGGLVLSLEVDAGVDRGIGQHRSVVAK